MHLRCLEARLFAQLTTHGIIHCLLGVYEAPWEVQRALLWITCTAYCEETPRLIEDEASDSRGDIVEVSKITARAVDSTAVYMLQTLLPAAGAVAEAR